jgi:hypothetical protein
MKQFAQFIIYSQDYNKTVAFTTDYVRKIPFTHYRLMYRFYDIDERHAMALYGIVSAAFATGNGFFGKVSEAVDAYCKACDIETPIAVQVHK